MRQDQFTDDGRTATLAEKVLGWKTTPDRFIKHGRSWIPRSRFRPFEDIRDTLRLLERAANSYSINVNAGVITVTIQISDSCGTASGKEMARTIATALCCGIGIPL